MANDFTGKKAEVRFNDDAHYKLEYLKDNKMKWTALSGSSYVGIEDIVDINVERMEDGHYIVTWISSEAETVIHIIDLNNGTVQDWSTWKDESTSRGRSLTKQSGTFKFINEDGSIDATPFTKKEIVRDFNDRFFTGHDLTAIDDYVRDPYIQHNPYMTDGVAEFRNFFASAFKGDWKDLKTEIKHIDSADNKVFVHSLVTTSPNSTGMVNMDIFRVNDDGKIVEHWDMQQPYPNNSVNPHPMF